MSDGSENINAKSHIKAGPLPNPADAVSSDVDERETRRAVVRLAKRAAALSEDMKLAAINVTVQSAKIDHRDPLWKQMRQELNDLTNQSLTISRELRGALNVICPGTVDDAGEGEDKVERTGGQGDDMDYRAALSIDRELRDLLDKLQRARETLDSMSIAPSGHP